MFSKEYWKSRYTKLLTLILKMWLMSSASLRIEFDPFKNRISASIKRYRRSLWFIHFSRGWFDTSCQYIKYWLAYKSRRIALNPPPMIGPLGIEFTFQVSIYYPKFKQKLKSIALPGTQEMLSILKIFIFVYCNTEKYRIHFYGFHNSGVITGPGIQKMTECFISRNFSTFNKKIFFLLRSPSFIKK